VVKSPKKCYNDYDFLGQIVLQKVGEPAEYA